jgi:hypothetical protein
VNNTEIYHISIERRNNEMHYRLLNNTDQKEKDKENE